MDPELSIYGNIAEESKLVSVKGLQYTKMEGAFVVLSTFISISDEWLKNCFNFSIEKR
jgi:hypothetical protein